MSDQWLERVNRALWQYDMGLLDVHGVAEVLESRQPSDLPTSRRGEAGDGPSTTFDPAPLGSHTQPIVQDHTNGSGA